MMHLKLAIDLDGVLCRFDDKFAKVLTHVTGRSCVMTEPDTWEWPSKLGFSREEEQKAWEYVATHPAWWRSLDRYADSMGEHELTDVVTAGHDLYFVTARHSPWAKRYSEMWLSDFCHLGNPTVILAKHKGLFCRSVGIHAFIDDKPAMCMDVRMMSPKTRSYLRLRNHNETARAFLESNGVITTDSLQTFFSNEFQRLRPTLSVLSPDGAGHPA
jgi:5'(3')-deoxyribonucleotidase